jgi:hypothetical protein
LFYNNLSSSTTMAKGQPFALSLQPFHISRALMLLGVVLAIEALTSSLWKSFPNSADTSKFPKLLKTKPFL